MPKSQLKRWPGGVCDFLASVGVEVGEKSRDRAVTVTFKSALRGAMIVLSPS